MVRELELIMRDVEWLSWRRRDDRDGRGKVIVERA